MAFYYIPHSPGKTWPCHRNVETSKRLRPRLPGSCARSLSSASSAGTIVPVEDQGMGMALFLGPPLFMEVKVYLTITIINWNNICSLILKHLPKW